MKDHHGWLVLYVLKGWGEHDYIFPHWAIARDLWSWNFFFFFLCCVSWILAYSIKDLLVCWRDGFKGHQITNMWNTIPLCLVWCIWNEHNYSSFEGIESLLHLKFIFHRSLLDWLKIIWDFSCSCLWFFDLYKKSFHFSIFMGNHILC